MDGRHDMTDLSAQSLPPRRVTDSVRITLEMIKIEHTLFALPFALLGAVAAARGLPSLWTVFWIAVAMVGARSAAMAFNRLVDRDVDAENPRTAMRALPAGLVGVGFVRAFTIGSALLFLVAAAMLNGLALALSPIALASVLGYSYTKRFTSFSHLWLGWALSIAPTGAWVAVRGDIRLEPVLLSAAVLLWTAGFDVLYACQDADFDRSAGLHSIPSRIGVARALWVSRGLHALMFVALVAFVAMTPSGVLGIVGVCATLGLLVYQHSIVRADDLSRLNAAFFTTNAFVSVILFATVGGGILWFRYA